MSPLLSRRKKADIVPRTFTVAEYHQLAEAGIFGPRERVELLDGLIVTMPPIGMPHWSTEADAASPLWSRIVDHISHIC